MPSFLVLKYSLSGMVVVMLACTDHKVPTVIVCALVINCWQVTR